MNENMVLHICGVFLKHPNSWAVTLKILHNLYVLRIEMSDYPRLNFISSVCLHYIDTDKGAVSFHHTALEGNVGIW